LKVKSKGAIIGFTVSVIVVLSMIIWTPSLDEYSALASASNSEEEEGSDTPVEENEEPRSQELEEGVQQESKDNTGSQDQDVICPSIPTTLPTYTDENGCLAACPPLETGDVPQGCPTVPETSTEELASNVPTEGLQAQENIAPLNDEPPLEEGTDTEALNQSTATLAPATIITVPEDYNAYNEDCNGRDDNGDTVVDWVFVVWGNKWMPICHEGEICDDSIDNDGDRGVDLEDTECTLGEICGDGVDNDENGLTDMQEGNCMPPLGDQATPPLPFESQPPSDFDPTSPDSSVEEQPPSGFDPVSPNQPEAPFKTETKPGFDPMAPPPPPLVVK
jgi:hypothetical protein